MIGGDKKFAANGCSNSYSKV